ncbi:SRPBCC family protein [Antrihabitans cavernicola]|uniref:SRPBCC family protein n=1 Tax=Antrihabitans cavernicola TaxID=2495913 RepID=A0A5A7S3J8_9NOCA|nr:SRPBCC family protein [Spelaeibacter cavernicola]KAA0019477.1 hypothetical protein FOY51_22800 [Spelaeibacter cavernicola]
MFASITPTANEIAATRNGDYIVARADVVMDRAFTVDATPVEVWPWLTQLGKGRAGWYLPRSVERFVPRSRRAIRHVEPQFQELAMGDVIPDYGGPHETFTVASVDAPHSLVYRSHRGRTAVSWSITSTEDADGTRIHLRLRLGPVRHTIIARTAGDLVDALTIAGMAAGLRERV